MTAIKKAPAKGKTRRVSKKAAEAAKTSSRSKAPKKISDDVTIAPPNFKVAEFHIKGNAPLVMERFGPKKRREMMEKMEKGDQVAKKKKRPPRDFKADCEEATHYIDKKKKIHGIPCMAFTNAMVSACRVAGYVMTRAKLALYVMADAYVDGEGLIKITRGTSSMDIRPAVNANGSIDLRSRPMFDPGWEAKVRIRFDADQLTLTDVTSLLMRAGLQVGLLAGRPDSKKSCGMGWGTFELVQKKRQKRVTG